MQGENVTNDRQWPKLLNIKRASLYSGLPIWTIRQIISNAKIEFLKIGHTFYLEKMDIDKYIQEHKMTTKIP